MADSSSVASTVSAHPEQGVAFMCVLQLEKTEKRGLTPGEAKLKQSLWDFFRTLDYEARRNIFTITDRTWVDFLVHLLKMDRKAGQGAGIYLCDQEDSPSFGTDDSLRNRKRPGDSRSG
jgi:hypothetical protein